MNSFKSKRLVSLMLTFTMVLSILNIQLPIARVSGAGAFTNGELTIEMIVGTTVKDSVEAALAEAGASGQEAQITKLIFTGSGVTINLTPLSNYINNTLLSLEELDFSSFEGSLANGSIQSLINIETVRLRADANIPSNAFSRCNRLNTVYTDTRTDGVVDLSGVTGNFGDSAFANCAAITTVHLPANANISPMMFYFCENLTTVYTTTRTNGLVDLSGVTGSFGMGAFYYCGAIESVQLPKNANISMMMFGDCSNLATIWFAEDSGQTVNVGSSAFSNIKSSPKAIGYVPYDIQWSGDGAASMSAETWMTRIYYPAVTNLSANPNTIESTGGTSEITVTGTGLTTAVKVAAFGSDDTKVDEQALGGITGGTSGTATLTFPANASASSKDYTIKVSLDDGVIWETVTDTVTVNAAPPPTIDFPTASGITYGSALSNATLSKTNDAYGTYAWASDTIIPAVTNSGYNVIFTPTNPDLYNYSDSPGWDSASRTIIRKVNVTVTPKILNAFISLTSTTINVGETLPNATVSYSGFVTGENAGNISGFTEPTISGMPADSMTAGTYNLAISGGNTGGNYSFAYTGATLSIASVAIGTGDYTLSGSIGSNGWYTSNVTVSPANGYDKISTDGATWNNNITVTTEGSNVPCTFYLKKSATGTTTTSTTINLKIDKNAPTGRITIKGNEFSSFLNTITFGLFFKNTVDVSITGTDLGGSGVASVQYYKSATAKVAAELGSVIWTSDSGFSVTANEKFFTYAKITDNAGNVTVIDSKGVVVYTDSAVSTNEINFNRTATTDVTANVILNGNTIDKIMNGGNTLISTTDYTVSGSAIIFKASYLDTLAAGDYTLTVSYKPMGESYVTATGNESPATTTIMLKVNKLTQDAFSITGGNITKTYGNAPFSVGTTGGSGTGVVSYEVTAGSDVISISGTTVTVLKAGSATIKATKAGDGNYHAATATISVTVNKKAITVIPKANQSKVFGSADQTFTYDLSPSLISGDSISGTLSRKAGEAPGTYAYTLGNLSAGANYTLSLGGKNTFEITKAESEGVTVSGEVIDSNNPSTITVTLKKGNKVIGFSTVKGSSPYAFIFKNVQDGMYNLVADNGSHKVTQAVTVSGKKITGIRIDMSDGNKQSIVEIKTSDTPPVAVDGLPKLFKDSTLYTASDEAVIASGGTVEFKLIVEKMSKPVDASAITTAVLGQTIGLYLDLSVIKSQFNGSGNLLSESKLTNLGNNLITVTFELPNNLKGKDNLTLYRVHNGKVETLTATPNKDGETCIISGGIVTLKVCKFSTYAIGYATVEKVANSKKTSTSKPAVTANTPKTGDDFNLPLWVLLNITALSAIAWLRINRRRGIKH